MVPRLVRNAGLYSTSMGGVVHLVGFFFYENFTKGRKFYKYVPCFYPIFPIALWDPPFYKERGAGLCEVN